jgi:TolA-binding protein
MKPAEPTEKCSHDLFLIRHEIELNLKLQRNKELEKEHQEFQEKLDSLDRLNDQYSKKKAEVTILFEKLAEKEKLLNEKEKELRASRIAFDRRKTIWEQEKENEENEMPHIKPPKFSSTNTNPLRSSMPCSWPSLKPDSSSVFKNGAPGFQATIESCQYELSEKVKELEKLKNTKIDSSKLEMQIDSLKNKIATLRGEQVMKMSCQSSKILSSLVQTMQKQNIRDEIARDRKEIVEKINSSFKCDNREVFKIKQLEVKMPEKTETKRRFLFSDAPTPKSILTPRTCEKEDPYKVYFENKKKMIQEKEMELAEKEKLLKDVFREIIVKYPDAKDIIGHLKRRNRG